MNAYDKALSLLALREHTAKEIEAKLKNKGYESEEISAALSRLVEEGAIDDSRYIESYVRSRSRKTSEGAILMAMRLKERGVDRQKVDEYLSVYRESDEYMEVLKKGYDALISKKGEEGAVRSLLNKGYSMSEIRRARKMET